MGVAPVSVAVSPIVVFTVTLRLALVGNESETALGVSRLQNCCARLSALLTSLEPDDADVVQFDDTQLKSVCVKFVLCFVI